MTAESPLSGSLKVIQYWKWWLTDPVGLLPLRGMWTGCRNGPTFAISALQQRKMQSSAAQEHRLRANRQKGGKKAEKGLRLLVDIKMIMSLQTTFVANEVNSLQAALGKTISSRSREGILPLCSGLVRQIWSAGTSASLPSTTGMWTYC